MKFISKASAITIGIILGATAGQSDINLSEGSVYINEVHANEDNVPLGIYTSKINNLEIRKSATDSSNVVFRVGKSVDLEVMLKQSSGWYKVKVGNKVGWTKGTNLKEKLAQSPTRYMSGARRTTLRNKAVSLKNCVSYGYLYEGEKVSLIDTKGNYSRIKYNDRVYYVTSSSLTTKNPSKIMYVSGASRKLLKESPTVNSKDAGYIYEGEKIQIVGTQNGFYHIIHNGKRAYAHISNMSSKNPCKTMYISGAWRKLLKTGPSTLYKDDGYIYEGDKFTLLGVYDNFYHVMYNGKRTYLYKTNTTTQNPSKDLYVNGVDKVAITNNDGSKIYGYASEGQKIRCFGVDNNQRMRVQFNNATGYVQSSNSYLKSVNRITVSWKYINSKTDIIKDLKTKEPIKKLNTGDQVIILEYFNGYAKVKFGDEVGYVDNRYLTSLNPTVSYYELLEDLNLRQEPTWSSNSLLVIKKNSIVALVDEANGWMKIRYGSHNGYVPSNKLRKKSVQEEIVYFDGVSSKVTVDTRYANSLIKVYLSADSNSVVKGYLKQYTPIEYQETTGDYAKVKINSDSTGYVRLKDINHRNLSKKNTEKFTTRKLSITHSQYIATQEKKIISGTIEDLIKYSNPENFSINNQSEKYQFLKLNSYRDVNVYELNEYLNNLTVKSGKKAIFKNQAQAFVDAAKQNNIDVLYLVAHTILETGYGSSTLAQGITVKEDLAGNEITPTVVHNLFGIGAVDGSANESGSKTAYALGWTSIPKAINGAAKWISTGVEANDKVGLKASYGYINSSKYKDQNTLFTMRFDLDKYWHQYASDPAWCYKISKLMGEIAYIYEGADLVFEKVEYKEEDKNKLNELLEDYYKDIEESEALNEVDKDIESLKEDEENSEDVDLDQVALFDKNEVE